MNDQAPKTARTLEEAAIQTAVAHARYQARVAYTYGSPALYVRAVGRVIKSGDVFAVAGDGARWVAHVTDAFVTFRNAMYDTAAAFADLAEAIWRFDAVASHQAGHVGPGQGPLPLLRRTRDRSASLALSVQGRHRHDIEHRLALSPLPRCSA